MIVFLIPLVCYRVTGVYVAMPRNSSTGVGRDRKSDEYWEILFYPIISLSNGWELVLFPNIID